MHIKNKNPFVYDADKGANGKPGTGDADVDNTAPETEEKDLEIQPAVTFATEDEYQEHINGIVQKRLERAAKKADKERDEAASKARADALKDQEKWQELAQNHEGTIEGLKKELTELTNQIAELETGRDTVAAELQKYKGLVSKILAADIENIPEHLRSLLDKLTTIEQFEYIQANRDTLFKKPPGIGTPKPHVESAPGVPQEKQVEKPVIRL